MDVSKPNKSHDKPVELYRMFICNILITGKYIYSILESSGSWLKLHNN